MAYVHIDDDIVPYLDILIDCVKLNGKDIKEQIERITSDTKLMGECLDDQFLEFKKTIGQKSTKSLVSQMNASQKREEYKCSYKYPK